MSRNEYDSQKIRLKAQAYSKPLVHSLAGLELVYAHRAAQHDWKEKKFQNFEKRRLLYDIDGSFDLGKKNLKPLSDNTFDTSLRKSCQARFHNQKNTVLCCRKECCKRKPIPRNWAKMTPLVRRPLHAGCRLYEVPRQAQALKRQAFGFCFGNRDGKPGDLVFLFETFVSELELMKKKIVIISKTYVCPERCILGAVPRHRKIPIKNSVMKVPFL